MPWLPVQLLLRRSVRKKVKRINPRTKLKRLAQRKLNKIGKIFFRVNYMLETP